MSKTLSKDYWNYDYVDLSVKTNNTEEVVLSYNTFGWTEIDRYSDRQYKDVLHLSFKRKHKIPNKDRLQYLQVSYEMLLNRRNAHEYRMHEKSSLVLTILCVLLASIFIAGVLILSTFSTLISNLVSCGLMMVSTIGILFSIKLCRKMRKKEKVKYINYANKINGQISEVLSQVAKIRGEQDEK